MLGQLEQAKQKWGGAHSAIDNWLLERQKLLVQYCELAGLPPYEHNKGQLPDGKSIRAFCQRLVDYVSTGHFEVYDKIASQSEDESQQKAVSERIIPKISDTTEHALAFNDKFASIDNEQQLQDFDSTLSSLGQILEDRFELEDQLIHTIHREYL